jgi:ubiquinone biosynthesis protein
MQILQLNKNYKNLTRLIKIVSVIGKYGFSELLSRMHKGLGVIPDKILGARQEKTLLTYTPQQRVRLALEELGPAFTKLGQILSLRPDIIPPSYAQELEKLQDRTPPVQFKKIMEVIQDEFTEDVLDVFSHVEETPVASASVAQVHRAVLKHTGEVVAIKVLKPGTRAIVEKDLSVVTHLLRIALNYLPELRAYNPLRMVSEFSEILLGELNFHKEANTIERFSRFFSKKDYIHIPKIYKQYSTNRVLVMEYIEGIKISDIEALDRSGVDRKKVAQNATEIFLREIFEFGFFHADPHPGNIFILRDNTVAPVDFGITGYVDDEGVQIIGNILLGLMERDVDKIIRYLKRYNFITDETDERRLKIDLIDLMDSTWNVALSQIDVSRSIREIFTLTRRYRIQFPGEYFLIFKTLLEVDGVTRRLQPEYNIAESIKPYMRRWFMDQYSPKKYIKDLVVLINDLNYFLRYLPTEMGSIIKRIRYGKWKLPLVHENLEKAVSDIDRTGNRLSFSVIIASLLLSSAIIVQAKVGPFIRGYPVLGLAGFFIAAVMGIWLLFAIIRSGKL